MGAIIVDRMENAVEIEQGKPVSPHQQGPSATWRQTGNFGSIEELERHPPRIGFAPRGNVEENSMKPVGAHADLRPQIRRLN